MILRRSILQPAVLIGFIVSLLVLAVHFSLIKKQGKLVSAHRVMDVLENVITKEYGECHLLPIRHPIDFKTAV